MAKVELIMPKMGESIMEATILSWAKKVGDKVQEDETILEIATDKVDSEIPSPVDGVITEILFGVDDVVPVGTVIALIATEGGEMADSEPMAQKPVTQKAEPAPQPVAPAKSPEPAPAAASATTATQSSANASLSSTDGNSTNRDGSTNNSNRFYSPLVKSIAKNENVSLAELESIAGSGANGRVNKKDILNYISQRGSAPVTPARATSTASGAVSNAAPSTGGNSTSSVSGGDEIIQMDRMRKLIADHMVMSKQTSPHVTSFVEADVTNMVNWRNANKAAYQKKYGEKITFTPLIMEAVIKAIKDFPMVNVTVVDGDKIKVLKDINIGMAAALPTGNLIVPVIKNADYLNLAGLTSKVNDLAGRARANKLKPDDIQGGTFTLTNVGTFGNVMGTPIINQPQVAILAAGAIRKKPAVLETEYGDVIAVRQMMFLSHSYDHRVVDGFLGGSFVRRVADYMENFDINRPL